MSDQWLILVKFKRMVGDMLQGRKVIFISTLSGLDIMLCLENFEIAAARNGMAWLTLPTWPLPPGHSEVTHGQLICEGRGNWT